MKVTVTQLDANQLENEWRRLCAHTRQHRSDLVLLPEMCFSPWFPVSNVADLRLWHVSVEIHEYWLRRLAELGAKIVAGTAPTNVADKRYNAAYIWTADNSIHWVRHKTYLPNDDGYWEANWYDRAPIDFQAATIGDLCIGVAICTEIWFMQHAREYRQEGDTFAAQSAQYASRRQRQMARRRANGRRGFRGLLPLLESCRTR